MLDDVVEVSPSSVPQGFVHVTAQPCAYEESGVDTLGTAEASGSKQVKGAPLIFIPNHVLIDMSQDADMEGLPMHNGHGVFLRRIIVMG